jgi:hypothetical protein
MGLNAMLKIKWYISGHGRVLLVMSSKHYQCRYVEVSNNQVKDSQTTSHLKPDNIAS